MSRRPLLPLIVLLAALGGGPVAQAAVLTVNSLLDHDDGHCDASDCTLREAIEDADPNDTIVFDFATLPASGPVIQLQSVLPWLEEDRLTIDGYDCTGCGPVGENTALPADGLNLQIGPTIDGSLLPVEAASDLLTIAAEDVTIRGLNLINSGDEAILVRSGGDRALIEGCLIGTDRTGSVAAPNQQFGIYVAGAEDVTIGPYNLISGNVDAGVRVMPDGSTIYGGQLVGNLIGTDITGTVALPNGIDGVRFEAAVGPGIDSWTVGDGTEAGRNLISGNIGDGVAVVGDVDGLTLDTNTVGTDGGQTAPLPNSGWGVSASSVGTRRPDDLRLEDCVISGNLLGGVQAMGVEDAVLVGNRVGTDDGGTLDLGNGGDGIDLLSSAQRPVQDIVIGGMSGSGAENTVAFNAGDGIRIHPESSRDARRIDILVNSWFANGGLAVDLEMAGGAGDGPGAPPAGSCSNDSAWGNRGKAPPEIASAELIAGDLEVIGTSCNNDIIGLYLADIDPTGYGEPEVYLGATSADSYGDWTVMVSPAPVAEGELVTAMARDADPETSEASVNVPVVECDSDGDGDAEPACGGADCDDEDPTVLSGAPELCDGLDNDCDAVVPAAEVDGDGDGSAPCAGDCDDAAPDVFPGAPEVCDGVDTDCDGVLPGDELDLDGDGQPTCAGDCDDTDASILTGAPELCDGLDTDCDGVVPVDESDADADGSMACAGDCDDGEPSTWPGAAEACDGLDNDCDGVVPPVEADLDSDGWATCAGDCDDGSAAAHPGLIEESPTDCSNGFDDDCDGSIDTADPGCPVGDDDDSGADDDDSGADDDDSAIDDDDIAPDDDDSAIDDDDIAPDDDDIAPDDDDIAPDDDDIAPNDDDIAPDDDDSGADDDDIAPDDDDSAVDDDDSAVDDDDSAVDDDDSTVDDDDAGAPDSDGDGAADAEDCAPADPAIHPGAVEICDDGVDQDCDGDVDGGAGDPECWSTGCLGCHQSGRGAGSAPLALLLLLFTGLRRTGHGPRSASREI